MNKNQIVGGVFIFAFVLIMFFYVLTPQEKYSFPEEIKSKTSKINYNSPDKVLGFNKSLNDIVSELDTLNENSFRLYVYRAHVLASEKNARSLSDKIKKSGFPSFVEEFENNNKLFVVYVGPFLSKADIESNISAIKDISKSKDGEIAQWNL